MDVLEAIARDEIDAHEAADSVLARIESGERAERIYAALARWTWNALTSRQFDEDLRSWHRTLRDVSVAMRRKLQEAQPEAARHAERIEALSDLVRISATMADGVAPKSVAERAHVPEILEILVQAASGRAERKELSEALGLRDANLSRVLTLMVASGLVERQASGRTASYLITRAGIDTLRQSSDEEIEALRATRAETEAKIRVAREELQALERERATLLKALGAYRSEAQRLASGLFPIPGSPAGNVRCETFVPSSSAAAVGQDVVRVAEPVVGHGAGRGTGGAIHASRERRPEYHLDRTVTTEDEAAAFIPMRGKLAVELPHLYSRRSA